MSADPWLSRERTRTSDPSTGGEDGPDVAYSAFKSVLGGAMLVLGWAIASSGVTSHLLALFIGLGGGLIGSELRKTGVARVVFAVTLVALAGVSVTAPRPVPSNVALGMVGLGGIVLACEGGRRYLVPAVRRRVDV